MNKFKGQAYHEIQMYKIEKEDLHGDLPSKNVYLDRIRPLYSPLSRKPQNFS